MPSNILSASTTIPANLVGVCTGNTLTAPSTIHYKTVRNWDYKGTNGANAEAIMTFINPSSGTYNWNTFDQLFGNNTDKQVIFTLGNPPDYLVSRAAIGGAYRGTKGNMCPDDLVGWATAVQALVSRAKNTYGKTGIIWELWNEIDQSPSYGDSISLLGAYTKATSQAIKAIDPTAVVIGPSIAGANAVALPYAISYITASDGAGGTSATWLDGVSMHYYNQSSSQLNAYENPINYVNAFKGFQGAMAIKDCRLPIYVTETGVIAADASGWRSYQRRLLTFAAMGAKAVLMYSYDTSSYPMSNYNTQINQVSDILKQGSVISYCEVGVASVTVIVDGISYTF